MILHRSFIREVLQTGGSVLAILLSIFLVTRGVYFLRQAAEGDIPVGGVALLVVLKMTTYLDIMIPLVLYIALLLVTGRWIRDNELTVINACGIGMRRFLRPAFLLLLATGSLVALLSLYLSPQVVEMALMKERQYRSLTDFSAIMPGVFNETRGGRGVIFVTRQDRDSNRLRDVFYYQRVSDEDQILVSGTGTWEREDGDSGEHLVLEDGRQYRGMAGSTRVGVLDFEHFRLALQPRPSEEVVLPSTARSTRALLAGEHPEEVGQFHWRLSKVVMLPVLMLFALSFTGIHRRSARLPGMMLALLVYFLYFNTLGYARTLVERGAASPFETLWVVHAVFFVTAWILFHRRDRNLPWFPRRGTS